MIDEIDRAQHNAEVNLACQAYMPQTLSPAHDPDDQSRIGSRLRANDAMHRVLTARKLCTD